MTAAVIKTENLSKRYQRGMAATSSLLRDSLALVLRSPLKLLRRDKKETFWALKDISLEVREGEVLGLIGRNGSGKTTLLKILSRITQPTAGWAEIHGRVGSLLEVGTGFHPELTGRENTYLSGAILGMRKGEIARKFDEIVAFAELEKFIDTQVKHYSSGMYVRLAFAVAAHLEPEILLVDEVLAVGDISFQKKCLGRMGDVARAGRTVILVSHNLGAISRICERVIWLDSGELKMDAAVAPVVSAYQLQGFIHRAKWTRPPSDNPIGEVRITSVSLKSPDGQYSSLFRGDQAVTAEIKYQIRRTLSGCQIGTRILNSEGVVVLSTSDADHLHVSAGPKEPGCYQAAFQIPGGMLAPGSYSVLVAAHLPQRQVYDVVEQGVTFEVTEEGSLASLDGRLGVVTPLLYWETLEDTETR
jgi:lipopolysaccharide transport system ATP-binding protein